MLAENIYQLTGVCKNYVRGNQTLSILKNLNLEVKKGQAVCITGPSGIGKSTLLHLMGTLDQATSGDIFYRNKNLKNLKAEQQAFLRREKLGFVFQFHHLLPEFTALENVRVPAQISKRPKKTSLERAHFLLETLGLQDRVHHYPSELSGGEQQRVAIARALMNSPEVLLADEPVGNLDQENSQKIRNLFFKLHEKFKLTLISVSHDKSFAETFPTILKMEQGKLFEIKNNAKQ